MFINTDGMEYSAATVCKCYPPQWILNYLTIEIEINVQFEYHMAGFPHGKIYLRK